MHACIWVHVAVRRCVGESSCMHACVCGHVAVLKTGESPCMCEHVAVSGYVAIDHMHDWGSIMWVHISKRGHSCASGSMCMMMLAAACTAMASVEVSLGQNNTHA